MTTRPLPFAEPALSDAIAVRQLTGSAQQSDLSFANIYLLRHKYGTEIALQDGFLFRHFSGHGRLQGYAFPCGAADPSPALRCMELDAAVRQRPFRFCLLTEEQVSLLRGFYPGRFRYTSDPGDADYIYERSVLAELPGARFHRKRNHLERFLREFPHWCVQPLSALNAPDALSVAAAWLGEEASPALRHEYEAIAHALESMPELALFGAVLYVEGAPVAMTIASMLSPEVADIHYEKCLPSFRSAYPLINREMARLLSCPLMNREEDINIPGLRQAKLSYFPSLILSKFNALPC